MCSTDHLYHIVEFLALAKTLVQFCFSSQARRIRPLPVTMSTSKRIYVLLSSLHHFHHCVPGRAAGSHHRHLSSLPTRSASTAFLLATGLGLGFLFTALLGRFFAHFLVMVAHWRLFLSHSTAAWVIFVHRAKTIVSVACRIFCPSERKNKSKIKG